PYDAALLTESREKAEFFRASLSAAKISQPVSLAHWVNGEMSALLNERNLDFAASPVAPRDFARLHDRVQDSTLSSKAAKEVLHAMTAGEGDPDAIIERKGLRQISDSGALEEAVREALAANPKLVEDYRAGKEKAFNALVGQVMKATKGKGNPQEVSRILRELLAS
ncbi:MAG TPA: Asp-tRNA(Asn)/Glu-tRNA(Gln) amidotransferase GatCAB subunit B, partial [Usitatibacter sp.]